jgi:hypothetical protein
MRRYVFVFCVAAYFSMPVWADSIRTTSATAQACGYECTGIVSTDLQSDPRAYNHALIGAFDSFNPRIADRDRSARLAIALPVFEYGRLNEKRDHRRHEPQVAMPESGSLEMLLASAILLGFSLWLTRFRTSSARV